MRGDIFVHAGDSEKATAFDVGLDEGRRAGGKRQISSPWGKALWCVKVREEIHALELVDYNAEHVKFSGQQ